MILSREKKYRNSCSTCEKRLDKVPSKRRDGSTAKNVFCNRDCYLKHHSEKNEEAVCAGCGKSFIRVSSRKKLNKFCSVACTKIDSTSICASCKTVFSGIKFAKDRDYIRAKRRTCSSKCLSDFYKNDEDRKSKISIAFTGDKHPMWRGGSSKEKQSRGHMWGLRRESLFAEKGESCEVCGISRKESRSKYGCDLHVDHIKPWHECETDLAANETSNLRPLCISCHGKHGKSVSHGKYIDKSVSPIERVMRHPKTKLTLDQCKDIKSMFVSDRKTKSNAKELAIKFSVSLDTIRNISKGRHWSDEYI